MDKTKWTLDSIRIYLSDENGKEIILNSGDLTDYTMTEIIDDVENYVDGMGGELQ
jgi:hypothetical protein